MFIDLDVRDELIPEQVDNEQPTWNNDTVFSLVTGRVRKSEGSSMPTLNAKWVVVIVVWAFYSYL